MRARLALAYCCIDYEPREISLKSKPAHLLEISPKATVPVLFFPSQQKVIDESLDIMLWALEQFTAQNWLPLDPQEKETTLSLIRQNDFEFKPWLDKYKYADRHLEMSPDQYWQKACLFLKEIEIKLANHAFLGGDTANLADMAILPFIRQIAAVDSSRFEHDLPFLNPWLKQFVASALFQQIMVKLPIWQPS